MTHDLSPDGDRHRLRIERHYPHPVATVWRALTDPAELSGWFPAAVRTELRVGATMTFTFPDQPPADEGTVLEVRPEQVFAFAWNGEVLRWELHPDGDGTTLVFTHVFDDRVRAASFAAGWDSCLDALAANLGGAPKPEFDYPSVHESHVDAFGLDQGAVRDGDVVFDRAYPWPVPAVRAAIQSLVPPQQGTSWTTSEIPGGSRVLLVVTAPADPATALRVWRDRLAEVGSAARVSR